MKKRGERNVNIRGKFIAMIVGVGCFLVFISAIGYYNAQRQLTQNIESAMDNVVRFQADKIGNWLYSKAGRLETLASVMARVDAKEAYTREILGSIMEDEDIQEAYNARNADGYFITWNNIPLPPGFDARQRDWYQTGWQQDGLVFTDVYVDTGTKRQIVSVVKQYKDTLGNKQGVLGMDISLDILKEQVKKVNMDENGEGFILDHTGTLIAHVDPEKVAKRLSDFPEFQDQVQNIMSKANGAFTFEKDGQEMLFAYAKVSGVGWIVGMEIPAGLVYQELNTLRMNYILLTVIGIFIMSALGLRFSRQMTRPILALTENAKQLAEGNLKVEKLQMYSGDEIGQMAAAFNTMADHLRELICNVSGSSEQIAASSEELTAGAAQSAQAANHVAGTVTQVAEGMEMQMRTVEKTKEHVEHMVGQIAQVAQKTGQVTGVSSQAAESAQQGAKLMHSAMRQMDHIEKTVTGSADVVARLGENSKQISQIVDVISEIAGQTNLLALNAAIEAARAGEQGRGFAVVAEEVRKLAEQSQQATKKIADLIHKIQSDTAQAVSAMNSGSDEVKEGSQAIREVGGAFQDIISMIDQISARVKEIAASMEQMAGGSEEIVKAVEGVDEVSKNTTEQTQSISAATEEQSASTQEIASSASALAQMAQEMQNMIGRFKI